MAELGLGARDQVDALFVINQDVTAQEIAALIGRTGFRRVLVVTTHKLFRSEVASLREAIGACEVIVCTVADFLSDSELQACDDQASADLRDRLGTAYARVYYGVLFAERSLYHKNRRLHERLEAQYSWTRTYCAEGLGISKSYWRRRSILLGKHRHSQAEMAGRTWLKWRLLLSFLIRPTELHAIVSAAGTYFFNTTRRVRLRSGTNVHAVTIGIRRKLVAAWKGATLRPTGILERAVGPGILATTIHGYPSRIADEGSAFRVFLDGFHPSNYPRSYLDQFGRSCFVSADPLSVDWFTVHSCSVHPPPPFIEVPAMSPPAYTLMRGTVLLALNHAGDWSSLINRSDTDVLVEVFCEMAARFPALTFVVRPHPTMSTEAHEGERSRERLVSFVTSASLPNLRISSSSLEEDLMSCDAVVSEYSQVLIDALLAGKLGLIANLTGRRSFMCDYEGLGFSCADSESGISEWLDMLQRRPEILRARQAEAAERYNRVQQRWLSSEDASRRSAGADRGLWPEGQRATLEL